MSDTPARFLIVASCMLGATAFAADERCGVSNTTDLWFHNVDGSVDISSHGVAYVSPGPIVAKADDLAIRGTCVAGKRLVIVKKSKGAAIEAFVPAHAPKSVSLAEAAGYTHDPARNLLVYQPEWAPSVVVIARRSDPHKIAFDDLADILEQDDHGRLVPIQVRGDWPDLFAESAWEKGGHEREEISLRTMVDIYWAFGRGRVLTAATPDFDRKGAPAFFAPRVKTDNDAVIVEAWLDGGVDGKKHRYVYARATLTPNRKRRQFYTSGAAFNVDDGHVYTADEDGTQHFDGN